MSHNRDLKNAQADLNEAVDLLIRAGARHHGEINTWDFQDAMEGLQNAWTAFENLRDDMNGAAAASARDTSIAAAKSNLPSIATLRGLVCAQVYVNGPIIRRVLDETLFDQSSGMTCDELENRLHRTHQSVSSAVNYAESHGWIKDSKNRRKTRSGSMAIVFEPTDKLNEKMAERGRKL